MTSPEGGQSARALVGGLDADDRVGDARGIVVLHVLSDAAQFMQDRHADLPEMLGITDPRQLQDVQRSTEAVQTGSIALISSAHRSENFGAERKRAS